MHGLRTPSLIKIEDQNVRTWALSVASMYEQPFGGQERALAFLVIHGQFELFDEFAEVDHRDAIPLFHRH